MALRGGVIVAAALVLLPCAAARGEAVRLKNGNLVTGEVVVDKTEFIAVDLGFTVLEIPRHQVEAVEEQAEPGGPPPEAEQAALYMTARLERRSVNELVVAFGEGLLKVQTPKGIGSGFFINRQGHVITNAHVIQGETRVSAIAFVKQGESFTRRTIKDVEIVAVDPVVDLALLKVAPPEGISITPLYFGEMDRVRAGEPVFAIGSPFGLERSVSEGIVSHKARRAYGMLLVQTTAPINPGNSGGPLLNMRGEVIGVVNLKLGLFSEGMGFAVPVSRVKEFLKFHEAYAYDKDNPNTGYQYLEPPNAAPESEEEDEEAEPSDPPSPPSA